MNLESVSLQTMSISLEQKCQSAAATAPALSTNSKWDPLLPGRWQSIPIAVPNDWMQLFSCFQQVRNYSSSDPRHHLCCDLGTLSRCVVSNCHTLTNCTQSGSFVALVIYWVSYRCSHPWKVIPATSTGKMGHQGMFCDMINGHVNSPLWLMISSPLSCLKITFLCCRRAMLPRAVYGTHKQLPPASLLSCPVSHLLLVPVWNWACGAAPVKSQYVLSSEIPGLGSESIDLLLSHLWWQILELYRHTESLLLTYSF